MQNNDLLVSTYAVCFGFSCLLVVFGVMGLVA